MEDVYVNIRFWELSVALSFYGDFKFLIPFVIGTLIRRE